MLFVQLCENGKNGGSKNGMEKCFIPCEFDDCREKQCCTVDQSKSCNNSPSSLKKLSPAGSQKSKNSINSIVKSKRTAGSSNVSDADEHELQPMI